MKNNKTLNIIDLPNSLRNISKLSLLTLIFVFCFNAFLNSASACARNPIEEFLIDKLEFVSDIQEDTPEDEETYQFDINLNEEDWLKISSIESYVNYKLENSVDYDYLSLILIIEKGKQIDNFDFMNSNIEEIGDFIVDEYKKHRSDEKYFECPVN